MISSYHERTDGRGRKMHSHKKPKKVHLAEANSTWQAETQPHYSVQLQSTCLSPAAAVRHLIITVSLITSCCSQVSFTQAYFQYQYQHLYSVTALYQDLIFYFGLFIDWVQEERNKEQTNVHTACIHLIFLNLKFRKRWVVVVVVVVTAHLDHLNQLNTQPWL